MDINFGDKIKQVESEETKHQLDADKPICVRLDGKAFHSYTKGMNRPYDTRLTSVFVNTLNYLMEKTEARLGYTQSDEISLVFFKTASYQQIWFNGRVQKLTSVLSSLATAKFNQQISKLISEKAETLAIFDCRAWNVETLEDAADVFVWRHEDAVKNAISMASHDKFSNKELHGKHSKERVDMLYTLGIDYYQYPESFRLGTFAVNKHVWVELPDDIKEKAGTAEAMRNSIHNYHIEKLERGNSSAILFDQVFQHHAESVSGRAERKMKMTHEQQVVVESKVKDGYTLIDVKKSLINGLNAYMLTKGKHTVVINSLGFNEYFGKGHLA